MDYSTNRNEEYREVVKSVGEVALTNLRSALYELNKAKNWSIADIFGGGLISTSNKQKHLQAAKVYISDARYIMEKHGREYSTIAYHLGTDALDMNGALGILDYSRHDAYADAVIHDGLAGVIDMVNNAITQIEDLLAEVH